MRHLLKLAALFLFLSLVASSTMACIRISSNTEDPLTLRINGREFTFAENRLKGNGELITKTIAAPEFERVVVHRGIELRLREGIDQISVEADSNLMPYGVITCEGGTLEITIDSKLKSLSDYTMIVTCPLRPTLREIDATSAAKVVVENPDFGVAHSFTLNASSAAKIEASVAAPRVVIEATSAAEIRGCYLADHTKIEASSAGEVKANLQRGELSIEATSAAEVEAIGTVDRATLNASSSGSIEALKLQCRIATAGASSGGEVELFCTEELNADASSGGEVDYKGSCTARISTSSGGDVNKID